ncbi:MAG: amidohydrolase family protein [Calditrichaceae bacterium]|nr:amidohydrolase family protein [Calditrichia bacterium]NUQ44237.1 amidohydrolase family protein [Calditrichaceae bacterium]
MIPAIGLKTISFLLLFPAVSLHAQLAVKGETVYTMSGAPIADGIVLISNGKISAVGKAGEVAIPADYRFLSAKVVTPGLIDAHSVVGLAGIYNQPHDQDQLDKSAPIQPELRALDAYNPREDLVEWLRNLGVTTLHTGHAPGALVSGQSIIVKTAGATVAQALLDSSAMLTVTLGASVGQNFDSPGTRSKGVAMLRSEFLKAQDYLKKKQAKDESKRPARDLKMEALGEALSGRLPVLMTANRVTEISSALRLAKEFNLKLILDGAAEAYLLLEEIKTAGVPVIIHPTMARHWGDTQNASFETAAKLKDAGIRFAFQGGYESYVPKTRVVLYEAAVAAANGLGFQEALAALTIDSARILGVDNRVGSLKAGKDADLVLFNGDPFEYLTRVCAVIVNGEVVHDVCR